MEFEAGRNALVAGRLSEIGHRGGDLEWAIELLFGANAVVSDGIIAGGDDPGTKRGAGRQNVEPD